MIDLQFGDGSYTFALGLAQINEIETKCGCGLGEVFARILAGRYLIDDGQNATIGAPAEAKWRISDLIETIRQGLIGGAAGLVDGEPVTVSSHRANQLVTAYVIGDKRQPLATSWTLAAAILTAAIDGYDDKKKERSTPDAETQQDQSSAPRDTQEP